MVLAAVKFSALELCYQGQYLAAGEALGLRPGERPENVPGGNYAQAERYLVAGVISSTMSGIQQTGDQVFAREMFNESIRLYGDDPRVWEVEAWRAWSYYWTGEYDDVIAITDNVLSVEVDSRIRFRTLLLLAMTRMRQGSNDAALYTLKEMEPLYDEQSVLLKGKFHLQRANVLESMHETDRAIAEFDYASEFFKLAGDVRCQAIAVNNLASLYRDTERYEDAHVHATRARVLFEQLGDKTYQAKALDQTASIFLAEGEYGKAEEAISSAIALLANSDPVLTECLKTHGKIKNIVATDPKGERGKIDSNPRHVTGSQSHLPERRVQEMTPLSCATRILRNPDNAADLYALLVFASEGNGDLQHNAELDQVEAVVYAMTLDSEKHRESYRKTCLDTITSDS